MLLLGLLLLLLVLLLMIVGLERAQHEYGTSNEQDLNISESSRFVGNVTLEKYRKWHISHTLLLLEGSAGDTILACVMLNCSLLYVDGSDLNLWSM